MTIEISFPYRHTKYGAVNETVIYTLDGKLIEPSYCERSRSGRHGTDYYVLQPGKYVIVIHERTNSGKCFCLLGTLIVEENRYRIEEWKGRVPDFVRKELCPYLKHKLSLTHEDF